MSVSPMLVDSVPGMVAWFAAALLAYTYVGYPVLLWLLGKWRAPLRMRPGIPRDWPTVTVIISAHNEEAVIGRRIRNLLEQDYPKDRLHILIGSDGSSDGTADEVSRHARFAGVQLAAFAERRGKATVLNDLVARATGDYLVFTDAATVFYPDAIKQLIIGFYRYPTAAVIGGKLELRSSDTARNADGLYWRYEMFLKTGESEIGAGLGASGAIYAVRRRDYRPLPAQTMADDLLEPLLIRMHTGGDVVLHTAARAWQLTPQQVTDEFRRRIRTGGGIAHALSETRRLLLPEWGTVSLALWSHKALRLMGPWILLAVMGGTVWSHQPASRLLFALQAVLYGAALLAGPLRVVPAVGKAAVAARYFVVLNAALAVGSLKFLLGLARPTWDRTERPAEQPVLDEAWPPAARTAKERRRPAA